MNSRSKLGRLAVLHAVFALAGAATALIGPILPALSLRWHLNDIDAGRLVAAQYVGASSAALASTAVFTRFGIRFALPATFVVVSLGFLACTFCGWPVVAFAILIYGAGLGLATPAVTLALTQIIPGDSGPSLNLLNFTWCAGAVLASPLATAAESSIGLTSLFALFAIAAAAAALLARLSVNRDGTSSTAPVLSPSGQSNTRLALWTGALLFLYSGTETALGSLTPLWATHLHASQETSAYTSSCFWGGILIARLVAPVLLPRIHAKRTIAAGLALSGTASVVMLVLANPQALLIGVSLAGLGFGAIFPTVVAMFVDAVGEAASRSAYIVFSSGPLGGIVLPLIAGWCVSDFGGVRAGLAFVTFCISGMFLLKTTVWRKIEIRTALPR